VLSTGQFDKDPMTLGMRRRGRKDGGGLDEEIDRHSLFSVTASFPSWRMKSSS
jgi:hypothetical protein